MYRLPRNIDLDFLIEKELESVSIAFNSLVLNFDEPIRMTINSRCTYKLSTGYLIEIEDYPKEASLICKLLGKKIVKADGDEFGTLTLAFDNGDVFSVYDDSENYESYMIKGSRNGDIIV